MLYHVPSRENIVWTRENNFHDITFDVSCVHVMSILIHFKNKIIHYGNFQHEKKVMINTRCKKCRKKIFHLKYFHIQRDYWRGKKKEFYWRFTTLLCNNIMLKLRLNIHSQAKIFDR